MDGRAQRRPYLSDGGKIAACWAVSCVLAVGFLQLSGAADITPGYTFTPAEKNITDVKLNAAASGTVATGFYTNKSANTAVAADTMLFFSSSAGTYKKTTLTTLFGNLPAVNGLSTINSVGNFSVATSKFTVAAASGDTAIAGNLTVATNLTVTGTSTLTGTVAAGGNLTVATNLTVTGTSTLTGTVAAGGNLTVATNLTVTGAQTNAGSMTLGDAAADTITINGTLAGTLYGAPVVGFTNATPLTTDKFLFQASGDSSKLRIGTLPTVINTFTTNGSIRTTTLDVAHGLGGTPDAVNFLLVCTNAELGYAIGDELPIYQAVNTSENNVLMGGANTTNVFFAMNVLTAIDIRSKTNAAAGVTPIVNTNWNVRVRAIKKP